MLYSDKRPFTSFTHISSPIEVELHMNEGVKWVEVPIPDIEVDRDFFIHVYAGTPKWRGFHMGADDSVTNKHSDITVAVSEGVYQIRDTWPYPRNMWFADKSKVNWMIRVIGHNTSQIRVLE